MATREESQQRENLIQAKNTAELMQRFVAMHVDLIKKFYPTLPLATKQRLVPEINFILQEGRVSDQVKRLMAGDEDKRVEIARRVLYFHKAGVFGTTKANSA